jgi:hypothetical protein
MEPGRTNGGVGWAPVVTDTADTFVGRFRRIVWLIVPAWFLIISAIRLSVLLPLGLPGYDGMLYRDATLHWLAGGNPWATPADGAVFGAPPPTLLAMLPFAILPEGVARLALLSLGVIASVWLIRRLRLPFWWLAFPPLVDGLYIANPHVFVAPLIVAGIGPLAVLTKIYAGPVLLLLLRWRSLLVTVAIFVVTVPFLPWSQFIAQWPSVSAALASQSRGGLSVLATPWLIPVAVAAAVLVGRERLAWWVVPVFWPYTQWYYASIALPVVTPLAAMALAMPIPGATTLAIALAAGEVVLDGRRRTAREHARSGNSDELV